MCENGQFMAMLSSNCETSLALRDGVKCTYATFIRFYGRSKEKMLDFSIITDSSGAEPPQL